MALLMTALSATELRAQCGVFDDFVFAGGMSERQQVERAVDTALSPMFFAVRPVARRKLSAGIHVSTTLAFRQRGKLLVSEAEGSKPSVSDAGGTPIYFLFDGSRVTLQQHADPARITQIFTTRSGRRENIYALSPENGQLTLSVIISAPQLPQPVHYSLTYVRSPQSTCGMDEVIRSQSVSRENSQSSAWTKKNVPARPSPRLTTHSSRRRAKTAIAASAIATWYIVTERASTPWRVICISDERSISFACA